MDIKRIFISFSVIIIIAISSAVFTIVKMKELSDNTQQIYTHPFQVTNAVANMKISIVTIHRNMKDIVLSPNNKDMILLIELIQTEEEKVFQYLKIVSKYYLGNKEDVQAVYELFKAWKPIRNEVIKLIYEDKLSEAIDITKNKGFNHINKLYSKIDILEKYALNKANVFYEFSLNNSSMEYVILVFLLTLIISIFIVYYITLHLFKIGRINNKQLHLIDQNILMATINVNKELTFISNALCFLLNKNKSELLHTKQGFFFCSDDQFKTFENKINLGKEHKGEIYLTINNERVWFAIEIYPELNSYFELTAFNIFLNNIDDKKKIEKISITDKLTSLHNRNYFELIFEKEVLRAKRAQKDISLIMFDIDFFKQFNDTYGHQEGDFALKDVSKVLSKFTNRSYDYAFRLGGEEFIIITFDKTLEQLEEFTQNIIHTVEDLKISHKNSSVSNYLTVSAGAILFKDTHLLTQDQMYKSVDKLLYESKNSGRNKVTLEVIE